tara:strand:+ start:24826 stop:25329 length:504 start_codon:yes stop_codon:yes gene_type:complete
VKIGDFVVFKNDSDTGTIKEIISERKIKITNSQGFDEIILSSEIIVVDKKFNQVSSYGDIPVFDIHNNSLEFSNEKIKKASKFKIDLHIENLVKDFSQYSNDEIIKIQVNFCEKQINKILKSNQEEEFIIVHGIGMGVLKKEIHNLLNELSLRYYLSNDGGSTLVFV